MVIEGFAFARRPAGVRSAVWLSSDPNHLMQNTKNMVREERRRQQGDYRQSAAFVTYSIVSVSMLLTLLVWLMGWRSLFWCHIAWTTASLSSHAYLISVPDLLPHTLYELNAIASCFTAMVGAAVALNVNVFDHALLTFFVRLPSSYIIGRVMNFTFAGVWTVLAYAVGWCTSIPPSWPMMQRPVLREKDRCWYKHCRKIAEEGAKECSRCGAARYCSKECQRKDWKAGHKLVCRKVCSECDEVD